MLKTSWFSWVLSCLLLSSFVVGVGYAALLPPFEGYDEIAHYARIKEQAHMGEDPSQKEGQITAYAMDYARNGPMPYGWIHNDSMHRDEDKGIRYQTYEEFFAAPERVERYALKYRHSPTANNYTASENLNWQYQHPPLYYALMVPVMKMAERHAFITEFLILRLFSWGLAFAGFCLGLWATWRHLGLIAPDGKKHGRQRDVVLFAALYPFFLPMFFPEFARIGNDSLVLLLFGLIWAALLAHLRDERDIGAQAMLGLALGGALLTKAFMIPVMAGLGGFLLWRCWRQHGWRKAAWKEQAKSLGLIMFVAVGGAQSWYLRQMELGFAVPGALDLTQAARKESIFELFFTYFSWAKLHERFSFVIHSWIGESASMSLLGLNLDHAYFLVVPVLMVYAAYFGLLRHERPESAAWVPVWVAAPFLAGLLVHIAVMITRNDNSPTPGWYLHTLAPALAFAFGLGLWRLTRNWLGKIMLVVAVVGLTVFQVLSFWAHTSLFAGCLTVPDIALPRDVKAIPYVFLTPDFCLSRFDEIMTRVGVLAWPLLAIACFSLAVVLLAVVAFMLVRSFKRERQKLPPERLVV